MFKIALIDNIAFYNPDVSVETAMLLHIFSLKYIKYF